jgi:DNA-binding protein HU-beta
MTKAEIIAQISDQTGLQKKEVAVVIESFMETVKKSMVEKKENVYLRGFGSFIIKHRAKKTARDIGKNITISIAAHDLPSFKPAKVFMDAMKGETMQ